MKLSFLIVARVIAVLLLVAIVACCFVLPPVVKALCEAGDLVGDRSDMTRGEVTYVTVTAYVMLAVAAFAIVFLWRLLGAVKRGEVFSQKAISILFTVTLAAFGEALLFLAIAPYFQLAIGVSLAVALLGFSLLVVCEVLKEASRLKQENDLTV